MSLKIRYAKRKLAHVRCGAVLVAKVACWSCGFCVCESLEMDADASVPLPKSVARQMNPFHRLMRSYKLGLVGMLLVTSALAAEPLVTVAPTLMILTWLGATEMRNMQRFFDLTTGWYMAIIVVGVSRLRNESIISREESVCVLLCCVWEWCHMILFRAMCEYLGLSYIHTYTHLYGHATYLLPPPPYMHVWWFTLHGCCATNKMFLGELVSIIGTLHHRLYT